MSWGGRQARRLVALTLATYGNICHLCGHQIMLHPHQGTPSQPCAICGEAFRRHGFSADHKLPRKHGGSNHISNLRPAHQSCNYKRGSKLLEDFVKVEDSTDFFKSAIAGHRAPPRPFFPDQNKNSQNAADPGEVSTNES